jgi:alcohol dehydrogenase class IV
MTLIGDPPASQVLPEHVDNDWWSFSTAGRVSFGVGCSRFLPDALRGFGTRVLVCTDKNLVRAGVVAPLAELLDRAAFEVLVYDDGEAEVGFEGAERCAEVARDFDPTVVVGLGGGSNLDLAKVVAARLSSNVTIARWSAEGIPQTALPVIALPTTAGTGSEVTPIAVLTDEANHIKVGFSSRAFLPRIVLVDPNLTLSCPPGVTAHSGMDALTHAVEAYLAIDFFDKPPRTYDDPNFVGKNPVSDALAIQSIELIGQNLERCVKDGSDLKAREAMALASLLAGMAFASAGTAIVHALQYPLGGLTKTSHGLGNATLLPSAVRFNLSARSASAANVSRALGSKATTDEEAAGDLPNLLGRIALSVGITPNLRSLGVSEDDLPSLASAGSRITRLTGNNPRPIDEAALLEVLSGALDFEPSRPTV